MATQVWAQGRWRGTVFAVMFGLMALAAVLAHRAFAPLLLLPLAVFDWKGMLAARRLPAFRPSGPVILYLASALAFCGWTALSAIWSPLPQKVDWSWRCLASFALALVVFASLKELTPAARMRAAKGVAWGVLAMASLLTFEALTGGAIRRWTPPAEIPSRDIVSLGRGTLLLTLIVWPAQRIFAKELGRPLLGWGLVALATIPALSFTIATNAVMLLAGFIAWAIARWHGARVFAGLCVMILAALWITPLGAAFLPLESWAAQADWLPDSWVQRLYIYARAGSEIMAHPFGGGVEYARFLSRPMVTVEVSGVALNTMPLHPHNLFLHVWMDLGVVGALALSGLIGSAFWAIRRLDLTHSEIAMIAAVIAALFVTAMTEWSVWQVWRFASVWIAVIACRVAIGGLPIGRTE